jgi:hypothetical protein
MPHLRRRIVIAAAIITSLFAASANGAEARPVGVHRYVLGAPDPVVAGTVAWAADADFAVACPAPGRDVGVGGSCFPPSAFPGDVEITVRDAGGLRVGGRVWFESERGDRLGGAHTFCERAFVDVPRGAAIGVVAVDSTVVRCGPVGGGVGTAGVITVASR